MAALGRARSRAASGVGEGALLQVRAAGQISSRLVWDSQAKRGSCSPGRRRDRLAVRRRINMDGASAQPLLTGKRWSTGRLSACRYGWKRLT
jgi:hypothetical protein